MSGHATETSNVALMAAQHLHNARQHLMLEHCKIGLGLGNPALIGAEKRICWDVKTAKPTLRRRSFAQGDEPLSLETNHLRHRVGGPRFFCDELLFFTGGG